jgi:predicted amidohydrolase
MRVLPVVLAQAPALSPDEAVTRLRRDAADLLAQFPATRMVIYPEYHTCRTPGPYDEVERRLRRIAEPLDGPRVRGLRAIARDLGVWLVPGTVVELGEGGELFNTAVAISPEGELAASYRKVFPWRPYEPFRPGDRFVTFDVPGVGRVGMCICYDLWFPEAIRQLAWMGAEVVVIPTQTTTRDREQELVLARAAAIQNQVFVLSVNAAAPDGVGQSIVVDPEGLVRAQAPSEGSAVLTDVLDLDGVSRTREFGTCGLNRMWAQARDGDPDLSLPMYDAVFPPARWDLTRKAP